MTTDDDTPTPAEPSPRTAALRQAVIDIERHVATDGWDAPVGVFALVRTAVALARDPRLAAELPTGAEDAARDPEHLTSIEQQGLPESANLEELLAQLAWPEEVDGTAVVVERIVVPPQAEADLPEDPSAALAALERHPERQDVRIAVGVLRSGESWCALRARQYDSDDAVAGAPDLVPGLVEAVRGTLLD